MTQVRWADGATGFISAGGHRLEFACFGPPPHDAPTIVMLHEGLGCVGLWRDFPELVSQSIGFGVFTYSRAGYGQSDAVELPRPLDYMTIEAQDVLPDVLDSIGLRCGILLGHSDGATISAIYAGTVSDPRIRGLVLIAPHFFAEEVGLSQIQRAAEIFRTGELRLKMAKYHRNPDVAFRGWNDAWLHPDFVRWNVSDVIDHLRIPVLAIQGEDDQYGTLAQVREIESRVNAPFEKLILPQCQHSPHLSRPQETVAAIARFSMRFDRFESGVVQST
ncbi:MAG: alpha/beta hydrolase [Acidiferrobacterales bacterium]|nr:alpha/beta hydrolase [Acidiferrobacterales bacterium]